MKLDGDWVIVVDEESDEMVRWQVSESKSLDFEKVDLDKVFDATLDIELE